MIRQRPLIESGDHRWQIQVTDDGSRTLIDPATGIAHHSAAGALAESQHVYLANSGMADRIQRGMTSAVLEIGFGTGTAMLLTLDMAITHDAALSYVAVEHDLVSAELLAQLALSRLLEHPQLADNWLAWRQRLGAVAPAGRLHWQFDGRRTVLLHHQAAQSWALETPHVDQFDAVYFDPFAPRENPELWSVGFLQHIFDLLRPAGRLVTYCVSRQVRDTLQRVGFETCRVPGPPGGKREVMIASKRG